MITVVYKVIDNSVNGLSEVCSMLLTILRGNIRTTFIASSLWFLTCLFVMELVFKLLKYLRNPMLILCITVGMHYIAAYIMSPSPVVKPHLLYNIDSMLYYIIFYAIGFLSYPYINKLFQLNSKPKLICYGITGCISALYSILVFSGHAPTFGSFNHLICSLTIIWFNLILAKMFEKVSLFVSVGRETLYLCGNEFIIRSIVPTCLNMIGLSQNIYSPIEAYLLTILYFAIELKILIPFEKQLVKSICQLKISDNK